MVTAVCPYKTCLSIDENWIQVLFLVAFQSLGHGKQSKMWVKIQNTLEFWMEYLYGPNRFQTIHGRTMLSVTCQRTMCYTNF